MELFLERMDWMHKWNGHWSHLDILLFGFTYSSNEKLWEKTRNLRFSRLKWLDEQL